MKSGQNLRAKLLLFLLLGGVATGLLVGFFLSWLQTTFGTTARVPLDSLLQGVIIGLAVSAYSFFVCRWAVIQYLGNLLDEFLGSTEADVQVEAGESIKDRASALFDLLNQSTSQLIRLKTGLERFQERARELLEPEDADGVSALGHNLEQLNSWKERLSSRLEQLQQDWSRLESTVQPLTSADLPAGVSRVADRLDELLELRNGIGQNVEALRSSSRDIQETVSRFENLPDRLRQQIRSTNELLLEMAELFREFPHPELPEKAEELRLKTREWEDVASGLEQVGQRLRSSAVAVDETVDGLEDDSRGDPDLKRLRERIKDQLGEVDNVIDQLHEVTEQEWLRKLGEQIDELQSQTRSIAEAIQAIQDQAQDEQERIRALNSLARELIRVDSS